MKPSIVNLASPLPPTEAGGVREQAFDVSRLFLELAVKEPLKQKEIVVRLILRSIIIFLVLFNFIINPN